MNNSLLVCGIDDSARARQAARYADALADRLEAGLVLVHVVPVPVIPGAGRVPDGRQRLIKCTIDEADRLLARIAAAAGCPEAEQLVKLGDPAQRLIAVAEEREASMLVIGSRGRRALAAALLGSVSFRLCRQAPCPVLVVGGDSAVIAASVENARRQASSAPVRVH